MAIWSDHASNQLSSLRFDYRLDDAQLNQLRMDINNWADVIGNEREKTFPTPNGYSIRVAVKAHQVINII